MIVSSEEWPSLRSRFSFVKCKTALLTAEEKWLLFRFNILDFLLANIKLFSLQKPKNLYVFLDDDLDSNNLPDDELEVYFNKLMPPAMQRGRVEGQEIPDAVRHSVSLC